MSAHDTARVREEARRQAPHSVDGVVGQRLHEVMATIARTGTRPDDDAIERIITQSTRDRPWTTLAGLKSSATAELFPAVHRGVRHLPPIDWALLAAEEDHFDSAGTRLRPDAIWASPSPIIVPTPAGAHVGRVVIDDYKLGGRVNTGRFRRHRDQIDAYLGLGLKLFGDDFLGVRVLLCLARSGSLLYLPHQPEPLPLAATSLNFSYTGRLRSSQGAGHGRPDQCVCHRCCAHRAARPRDGVCTDCGIALAVTKICEHCTPD